jgi:hypothetical protein
VSVRPGVWYTKQDIAAFRDSPELADLTFKGYVLQQDPMSGRMRFVHWSKSGMDQGTRGNTYGTEKVGVFDKREHLPPIQKRTPQQRMESLMSKVGDDLRFYLSGEAGREVSGEETRKVAAQHLQAADEKFEREESKKVVRTTGDPYN